MAIYSQYENYELDPSYVPRRVLQSGIAKHYKKWVGAVVDCFVMRPSNRAPSERLYSQYNELLWMRAGSGRPWLSTYKQYKQSLDRGDMNSASHRTGAGFACTTSVKDAVTSTFNIGSIGKKPPSAQILLYKGEAYAILPTGIPTMCGGAHIMVSKLTDIVGWCGNDKTSEEVSGYLVHILNTYASTRIFSLRGGSASWNGDKRSHGWLGLIALQFCDMCPTTLMTEVLAEVRKVMKTASLAVKRSSVDVYPYTTTFKAAGKSVVLISTDYNTCLPGRSRIKDTAKILRQSVSTSPFACPPVSNDFAAGVPLKSPVTVFGTHSKDGHRGLFDCVSRIRLVYLPEGRVGGDVKPTRMKLLDAVGPSLMHNIIATMTTHRPNNRSGILCITDNIEGSNSSGMPITSATLVEWLSVEGNLEKLWESVVSLSVLKGVLPANIEWVRWDAAGNPNEGGHSIVGGVLLLRNKPSHPEYSLPKELPATIHYNLGGENS